MTSLRNFLQTHDPVPEPPHPSTAADARRALAAAKSADTTPAEPRRTPRRLSVLAGAAAAAVFCAVGGGVVTSYLQGSASEESTAESGHDEVAPTIGTPDPEQLSTPEPFSGNNPTAATTPNSPASGAVIERDTPASATAHSAAPGKTLPLSDASGRWRLTDVLHQGIYFDLETTQPVTGVVTEAADDGLTLTFHGLCGALTVTWTQKQPRVFTQNTTQSFDSSCSDAQRETTKTINDILDSGTYNAHHTSQSLSFTRDQDSLVFTRP